MNFPSSLSFLIGSDNCSYVQVRMLQVKRRICDAWLSATACGRVEGAPCAVEVIRTTTYETQAPSLLVVRTCRPAFSRFVKSTEALVSLPPVLGSLDGRILIGNSAALLHCIRILITESKSSTAACIRLDYQGMCRSSKFGVRSGFVLISCLAGPKCATTTVQTYSIRIIAP